MVHIVPGRTINPARGPPDPGLQQQFTAGFVRRRQHQGAKPNPRKLGKALAQGGPVVIARDEAIHNRKVFRPRSSGVSCRRKHRPVAVIILRHGGRVRRVLLVPPEQDPQ